jgi:hypothetical protein
MVIRQHEVSKVSLSIWNQTQQDSAITTII